MRSRDWRRYIEEYKFKKRLKSFSYRLYSYRPFTDINWKKIVEGLNDVCSRKKLKKSNMNCVNHGISKIMDLLDIQMTDTSANQMHPIDLSEEDNHITITKYKKTKRDTGLKLIQSNLRFMN